MIVNYYCHYRSDYFTADSLIVFRWPHEITVRVMVCTRWSRKNTLWSHKNRKYFETLINLISFLRKTLRKSTGNNFQIRGIIVNPQNKNNLSLKQIYSFLLVFYETHTSLTYTIPYFISAKHFGKKGSGCQTKCLLTCFLIFI